MSQLRINWEGCGRKGIRRKLVGMMQAEATATQISWHSVALSAWMPLLALLALTKTRNMTGFQPLSGRPGVVPGRILLPPYRHLSPGTRRQRGVEAPAVCCCVLPSGTGSLTRVVLVKGPLNACCYLWPPYVVGQAIYIFILWFLVLSSSFFLA